MLDSDDLSPLFYAIENNKFLSAKILINAKINLKYFLF